MTEQEWLTSTDSAAMLRFATHANHSNAWHHKAVSDRKLCLWACACARQSWSTLDDRGRRAVVHCEDIADSSLPWDDAQGGDENWDLWRVGLADNGQSPALQATFLRDICGNPFRRTCLCGAGAPLPGCPRGARIRTPTVLAVARAAYEERGRVCEECKGYKHIPSYGPPRETHHCGMKMVERRDVGGNRDGHWPTWCPQCWWAQLPEHIGYRDCPACQGSGRDETGTLDPNHLAILADALEDAGADNEDILSYLRGPGPHVRGCWAIDCILEKE